MQPGQPEPLADAIESLLLDSEKRLRMGAAGTKRIGELFSWRVCAEKTVALYEEVLAARGRLPAP